MDAWLFAQINGGNCISLSLNKGYRWPATSISGSSSRSYSASSSALVTLRVGKSPNVLPAVRLPPLSTTAHKTIDDIVEAMDGAVVEAALSFPCVWDLVQSADEGKASLKRALARRYRAR